MESGRKQRRSADRTSPELHPVWMYLIANNNTVYNKNIKLTLRNDIILFLIIDLTILSTELIYSQYITLKHNL